MSFQEVVGLSGFCKFIVYKLVFSSECLNIFCELCCLRGFDLDYLILMFYLFPEVLIFLSQKLNLVLTLEEAPLEIVLFARDD